MSTSIPNNTCRSDAKEPGFLGKRPWLFVVGAFVLLFTAWTVLFVVAYKHQPENIPLVQEQAGH